MELLAALTLGLIGSFHCIGMCGPIAIALPLTHSNWISKILGAFIYNIGRAFTYGLMGVFFGLLGKGFKLAGLQQWVSIVMGAIMIISVLFPVVLRNRAQLDGLINKLVSGLKKAFSDLFKNHSYNSLFLIGLLNGFLPCGLVYMAIAGAVATGEVLNGAMYMVIFGLGTLPVMLSVSLIGNIISTRFRNRIRKFIPVFIVIIGILFILRGMNLGIKYISPKLNKTNNTEMKMMH
ncbi:MAG: sulfite exporter TauE/SafE family protein [Bacteroidetes bacterium]|nr:sulfite exporter TauE/SafE family protein [Bacteroidota bacterium]